MIPFHSPAKLTLVYVVTLIIVAIVHNNNNLDVGATTASGGGGCRRTTGWVGGTVGRRRQPSCSSPTENARQQQQQQQRYNRISALYSTTMISSLSPSTTTSIPSYNKNKNLLLLEQQQQQQNDQEKFLQLFHHLGATPKDLLRLQETISDDASSCMTRGVYLNRNVRRGETLLSIPLSSCLCNVATLPKWFHYKQDCQTTITTDGGQEQDIVDSSFYDNPTQWVAKLAALLLDLQLQQHQEIGMDNNNQRIMGQKLWLSLLPNNRLLRASLPIHWDTDTLQAAHCTALELAVDTLYFSRAQIVADLISRLHQYYSELMMTNQNMMVSWNELEQVCHDALDVVQTRSCRLFVEPTVYHDPDYPNGQTLHVLAPIFDFINHATLYRDSKDGRPATSHGGANACFRFGIQQQQDTFEETSSSTTNDILRSGMLIVTATRDISINEEVLIDYGSSARPAWRCLASYGFVPSYQKPNDDDIVRSSTLQQETTSLEYESANNYDDEEDEVEIDVDDDEHVAEVYIDGVRYEVGPSTIPFEMIMATEAAIHAERYPDTPLAVWSDTSSLSSPSDETLSPEIALRIAKRISEVANRLLLVQPNFQIATDDDDDDEEEENDEDEEHTSSTPEQLVSAKLAASLRWSQHKILLACAHGLEDWAARS